MRMGLIRSRAVATIATFRGLDSRKEAYAMQLDEDSKQLVAKWLEAKLGADPPCRMCGVGPLAALSIAILEDLPALTDNPFAPLGGQAVINLQCRECGFCHLFDAAPMGVSLPGARR